MVAYNFQPEFAAPILDGTKSSTIRPIGLRQHAVRGEGLQLYTGLRTKSVRLLMRVPCDGSEAIVIHRGGARRVFATWGRDYESDDLGRLAASEGFASPREMIEWFDDRYGLPTPAMMRIRWNPARREGAGR